MGLGGISFAVGLCSTRDQRGKSRVTMSMVVYDLRSNCAAGVWPLWHPMQYFVTKGLTVCSNCRSSAGVAAPAGRAAMAKMTGKARRCTKKLIIYYIYGTGFEGMVT